MKNLIYLFWMGLVVCLGEGCASSDKGVISKTLPAEKFQNTLVEKRGVLIDVRSKEEYAEAHISGAINIDVNSEDFRAQIDSLDKEKAFFIYCKSGKRSSRAADLMKDAGFRELYNLEGGISEWRERNFPVIKKEKLREGGNFN